VVDPIRVFVGSDGFQRAAGMERTLAHSIRSRTQHDVEIVFMTSGAKGFEVSHDGRYGTWAMGHEPGVAWSGRGWGTDFSAFRFAIPELSGFRGRAIYLDVDMIVLADIAELLDVPQRRPWVCRAVPMTDVSVIDCAAFRDRNGWPRIGQMKRSGWGVQRYIDLLVRIDAIGSGVPAPWNTLDREPLAGAKLAHFTTVPTQPWRPYPKTTYAPIAPAWEALWRREHDAAHAP
jgi:hypothetical protein